MIIELAKFTEQLAPVFAAIGLKPKEGLNILLKPQFEADGSYSIAEDFEWSIYSKKTKEIDPTLLKCATLTKSAWMIDTFKCLDAPYKAIHSCSPFCLAFKRTALDGGETFKNVATDIEKGKNKKQLTERIGDYFDRGRVYLLEEELELNAIANVFAEQLSKSENLYNYFAKTGIYSSLKDGDYIAIYLDLPFEEYQKPHNRYLQKKLFNTEVYSRNDENGITWGTSNFFNGFGNKKPFLIHKTAAFDISGRISSMQARNLFDFGDLLTRDVLPRPLPIFVLKEELLTDSINIFKREALLEPNERRKHADIITELYKKHQDDLGNYYLLYTLKNSQGKPEIKDFDYISKFQYLLKDESGEAWKVNKIMDLGEEFPIPDVFALQNTILPDILNNALVVKVKGGGIITKYFEDIDPKYCDNNNDIIYGLIQKYRKAWYDFIYKSKRTSLSAAAFKEMMQYSIISDLKRDEDFKLGWRICHKLNIWFSLNHHFDPLQTNFNGIDMSKTIPLLMEKMRAVANEDAHFESPEEFAFGAGQVIYFLLDKSKADKRTHALLEPFTQKTDLDQLKIEIARTFDRYKHAIDFGKGRFENLMREVLGYADAVELRKSFPILLAGYFAKPVIFEKKEKEA
jgi:CRISPR-associated protein Csh1